MEELRTFVDNTSDTIDWEGTEDHSAAYKELKEIYDWWVNVYPHQEDKALIDYPIPDYSIRTFFDGDEDTRTTPEYLKYMEMVDIHSKLEQEWQNTEEEMLIRLMKVRRYLWYP